MLFLFPRKYFGHSIRMRCVWMCVCMCLWQYFECSKFVNAVGKIKVKIKYRINKKKQNKRIYFSQHKCKYLLALDSWMQIWIVRKYFTDFSKHILCKQSGEKVVLHEHFVRLVHTRSHFYWKAIWLNVHFCAKWEKAIDK